MPQESSYAGSTASTASVRRRLKQQAMEEARRWAEEMGGGGRQKEEMEVDKPKDEQKVDKPKDEQKVKTSQREARGQQDLHKIKEPHDSEKGIKADAGKQDGDGNKAKDDGAARSSMKRVAAEQESARIKIKQHMDKLRARVSEAARVKAHEKETARLEAMTREMAKLKAKVEQLDKDKGKDEKHAQTTPSQGTENKPSLHTITTPPPLQNTGSPAKPRPAHLDTGSEHGHQTPSPADTTAKDASLVATFLSLSIRAILQLPQLAIWLTWGPGAVAIRGSPLWAGWAAQHIPLTLRWVWFLRKPMLASGGGLGLVALVATMFFTSSGTSAPALLRQKVDAARSLPAKALCPFVPGLLTTVSSWPLAQSLPTMNWASHVAQMCSNVNNPDTDTDTTKGSEAMASGSGPEDGGGGRVSYLHLAEMMDEEHLRSHIEKMVSILMVDFARTEGNGKTREKRQSEYRSDLQRHYLEGTAQVNAQLNAFVTSLTMAQTNLVALQRETHEYPAAAKPRCADWQCSLQLLVRGPRNMASQLGPVVALRRRSRRALAMIDSVKREGDAMVSTINSAAPPMDAKLCSVQYLAMWEDKWNGNAKEYKAARANFHRAVQHEQALATRDKGSSGGSDTYQDEDGIQAQQQQQQQASQQVQIWVHQVELLLLQFGKSRVQAADLVVACAELKPYKALVGCMKDLYKYGKHTDAGLDQRGFALRLQELQSMLEAILDEADEWEGHDVSEIQGWEARLAGVCDEFDGHVTEFYGGK